jgi:hypothetical protein
MKQVKLWLVSGVFIAGFSIQSMAQVTTLPEVTVVARNYKYLRSVDSKDVAQPVKLLERKAAAYDVKNSEYYEDEYDTYFITFYLPDGYVLAVYDQDGKLIRTAERFKDITLPVAVRNAVGKRYPNWVISKDVYLVKYEDDSGAKKDYKLVLENGNKRLRVKTNDKGEFLD